MILSGLGEDPD